MQPNGALKLFVGMCLQYFFLSMSWIRSLEYVLPLKRVNGGLEGTPSWSSGSELPRLDQWILHDLLRHELHSVLQCELRSISD